MGVKYYSFDSESSICKVDSRELTPYHFDLKFMLRGSVVSGKTRWYNGTETQCSHLSTVIGFIERSLINVHTTLRFSTLKCDDYLSY